MTSFVAPWSPNFTNDINNAITDVTNVIGAVVPGGLPPVTIPPIIPPPVIPTTSITPLPLPIPPPTTTVVTPTPPQTTTANGGSLEQVAAKAAEQALANLTPQFQKAILGYIQQYWSQALTGNETPPIPNVTFDGKSLTHTAAKGHAWRAFLIGMAISALSAVVTAIGSASNIDFFSKEGWMATATLVVGTLVSSVIAYLARLQITPEYEKQLALAPGVSIK